MAKKPYIISTFSGAKGELPSARLVGSSGSGVRQLPVVTASDNDKFLRVVSGAWAAATVPSAETASF